LTVVGFSRSASPVEQPRPTRDPALACRPVDGPDELAEHHRIRAEIFVREQGIFAVSDIDEHDHDTATIHLLGFVDGVAAGAVRLYPVLDEVLDEVLDPAGSGHWKGDRLAVLPAYRSAGIGRPLVRLAVATAGRLGGTRMIAHVQVPNTRYFQSLGWLPVGPPADYLGLPHQLMSIALR
jgi:putative N-acetyltransferase (TIGR04045 family)